MNRIESFLNWSRTACPKISSFKKTDGVGFNDYRESVVDLYRNGFMVEEEDFFKRVIESKLVQEKIRECYDSDKTQSEAADELDKMKYEISASL